MTRFVTLDHDMANRLRVAHLTGRLVTGSTGEQSFTKARVRSVRRDLEAKVSRWTVELEQDTAVAEAVG